MGSLWFYNISSVLPFLYNEFTHFDLGPGIGIADPTLVTHEDPHLVDYHLPVTRFSVDQRFHGLGFLWVRMSLGCDYFSQ